MPRLLQIASFLGGAILIFVFKAAEVKRTHWTGAQCRDASEGDAGAHGLTASRPARMSRRVQVAGRAALDPLRGQYLVQQREPGPPLPLRQPDCQILRAAPHPDPLDRLRERCQRACPARLRPPATRLLVHRARSPLRCLCAALCALTARARPSTHRDDQSRTRAPSSRRCS